MSEICRMSGCLVIAKVFGNRSKLIARLGHRFLAGPTVQQYADRLRDEMIRRRLQHLPINWPAYPLEASKAD